MIAGLIDSPRGNRRRHPIDHFQHRFRPQARQQTLRQVHPPNRPRLIHQKLRGTRDVTSLFASVLVNHSVGSNRLGARVGQNGERITLRLRKLSGIFRRIDADPYHLRAARDKFRQPLLKTP